MATDARIIQTMLQAAQAKRPAGMKDPDAADYDWELPHHFQDAQRQALHDYAEQIGNRVAKRLQSKLRLEQGMEAQEVVELYGRHVVEKSEGKSRYYLPFTTQDNRPAGFVGVVSAEAANWVVRLLGGQAADAEKKLSSLEVSLLVDLLAGVASEFCNVFQETTNQKLHPGNTVTTDLSELVRDESEEYASIDFKQEGQDETAMILAIASDVMELALGSEGADKGSADPEERQRRILEHLGKVDIGASVHLGTATARVRDLAALEPDDVLVLDTKVRQPVQLIVQGKPVLAGIPAQCEGHYAVQIAPQPKRKPEGK